MDSIKDGLKKLMYVGVGAVALTVEKTGEILDEMVEKGESTFDQGKALNKELKRTVKENTGSKCCETKDLSKVVSGLSKDELTKLKELIAEAENKE